MNMSKPKQISQHGFTLVEMMIVTFVMGIVLAAVFSQIAEVSQRSQSETVKTDMTQEAREFVDEFERDLHQAGYPNCRMITTPLAVNNCDFTNAVVAQNGSVAAGLVLVSNTEVGFEGDVDGNGTVDSVWYRIVDSAGNYPPTTTCPCTLQRSQVAKVGGAGTTPLAQLANATFSQELQNMVNSGVATGSVPYTAGSGLAISGNTKWGATNTAYYASVVTFKDYPVFTAYDQNGTVIALPLDISTAAGQTAIQGIKSLRLNINLLANAKTGFDLKNNTRPVETLVGNARLVNCGGQPCD
jgi:prepilin-type N-terminal cleavage/methylation domain-containing protein